MVMRTGQMMDLSVMMRRMMVVIAVIEVIEHRNSEVCISTFIHSCT